jgi:hypothetical protein
MNAENLYGSARVAQEARLVAWTLASVASVETCSQEPQYVERWTTDNPLFGHCQPVSEICKQIWGINLKNRPKWNPNAKFLVWWSYPSEKSFRDGIRKNHQVHHDFLHPIYGELDLTRIQFPSEAYLIARPKFFGRHERPITDGWDRCSHVPQRMQILYDLFIPALLTTIEQQPLNDPTPEFELFLAEIS